MVAIVNTPLSGVILTYNVFAIPPVARIPHRIVLADAMMNPVTQLDKSTVEYLVDGQENDGRVPSVLSRSYRNGVHVMTGLHPAPRTEQMPTESYPPVPLICRRLHP